MGDDKRRLTEMITAKPGESGGFQIIVLKAIEPGEPAGFATVAQVSCAGCRDWLWVTERVVPLLRSGEFAPVCQPCANTVITETSIQLGAFPRQDDK